MPKLRGGGKGLSCALVLESAVREIESTKECPAKVDICWSRNKLWHTDKVILTSKWINLCGRRQPYAATTLGRIKAPLDHDSHSVGVAPSHIGIWNTVNALSVNTCGTKADTEADLIHILCKLAALLMLQEWRPGVASEDLEESVLANGPSPC
eukprot:1719488-Amphidinium_carterae.4